jgi:hypothetical protein
MRRHHDKPEGQVLHVAGGGGVTAAARHGRRAFIPSRAGNKEASIALSPNAGLTVLRTSCYT